MVQHFVRNHPTVIRQISLPDTFPLSPLRLVVLISGGGTTLRNLIEQIRAGRLDARIERVISSTPMAYGLQIAAEAGIPGEVVAWRSYADDDSASEQLFERCRQINPHLVVCGGFLKKLVVPRDFENRVVNIHPSLIPAYCGHGYYGRRVHEAVLAAGEPVSGCTVHFVDNEYDHGPIIAQRQVPVMPGDTPESLAARVFEAECDLYPDVLRRYARGEIRPGTRLR